MVRFYRRQGALLALLYALEATDFHAENLIASGEFPVLIDLETFSSDLREHDWAPTPMPSYKDRLSPQEIADVVSYLVSLKGGPTR